RTTEAVVQVAFLRVHVGDVASPEGPQVVDRHRVFGVVAKVERKQTTTTSRLILAVAGDIVDEVLGHGDVGRPSNKKPQETMLAHARAQAIVLGIAAEEPSARAAPAHVQLAIGGEIELEV